MPSATLDRSHHAGAENADGSVTTATPGRAESDATEVDALQDLGDEIAILAAHIHAATRRLLELIAEFDRRRGWELGGHRSCADWLHATTGIDRGAAREKVRAARALEALPRTSEAMARGELSFSKVRALTRVATPECEEELLEVARSSTTAGLERFVRAWRKLSRGDEQALERERHRSRRLSVFPDDEGMYVVRGRLDPEVGALLMRAIEAAGDALFGGETSGSAASGAGAGSAPSGTSSVAAPEETTPKQRRADAIGLLAERALAAGFGSGCSEQEVRRAEPEGSDPETRSTIPATDADVSAETSSEARSSDASISAGSPAAAPPLNGPRAERYQVMLHVDPSTLERDGEPGRSHLSDGTRLSPETSRRLACDAAMVAVARGEKGEVLDVGRKTRTVPPALRRALEVRDGGCRFPGCGLRFCDAHHVVHWSDGGETKLDNLVLLCRFHHRLVHEEGWRVEFWGTGRHPAFIDPRGRYRVDPRPRDGAWPTSPTSPAPPAGRELRPLDRPLRLPDRPVTALLDENRDRGVQPDYRAAMARYRHGHRVPARVYSRAFEALDAVQAHRL